MENQEDLLELFLVWEDETFETDQIKLFFSIIAFQSYQKINFILFLFVLV